LRCDAEVEDHFLDLPVEPIPDQAQIISLDEDGDSSALFSDENDQVVTPT
jgi:hypothetical protein